MPTAVQVPDARLIETFRPWPRSGMCRRSLYSHVSISQQVGLRMFIDNIHGYNRYLNVTMFTNRSLNITDTIQLLYLGF